MNEHSHQPFFISCAPRSGSTYLCKLLMERFAVCIPPECRAYSLAFEQAERGCIPREVFERLLQEDLKFSDWGVDPSSCLENSPRNAPLHLSSVIQEINFQYGQQHDPATCRFGLKKGEYASLSESIASVFPETQFIGLVRDGRACFASQQKNRHSISGEPLVASLEESASRWCQMFELLMELKNKGKAIVVYFEHLLNDPSSTLESIASFLELPERSDNQPIGPYHIPPRSLQLHRNIEKSPMLERAFAWKMELSASEISLFNSLAGDTLTKAGYDASLEKG